MPTTTPVNKPDPNAVLMGSTAPPSLDIPDDGRAAGGTVHSEPESYHMREYDALNPGGGALKFFPSGDPMWGLRVDLQTKERKDADDDGVRRLYIEKLRMRNAIRDAILAAGTDRLELGAELLIRKTGTEPSKGGGNPADTFEARYTRPASQALGLSNRFDEPAKGTTRDGFDLGNAAQQALARQQAASQSWPAQPGTPEAAAPARPQVPAAVYAAMVNAGLDVSGYDITP